MNKNYIFSAGVNADPRFPLMIVRFFHPVQTISMGQTSAKRYRLSPGSPISEPPSPPPPKIDTLTPVTA